MSDALTRLALEAPTDAAARRIFEGGERDARDDPAARPRLLEPEQRERSCQAADLARRSRSIADDVNRVCGEIRCVGSLSLAVLMLAEAVEQLTEA